MQESLVICASSVRNLVLMWLSCVDGRKRAIIRPNDAMKVLKVAPSSVVVLLLVLLG